MPQVAEAGRRNLKNFAGNFVSVMTPQGLRWLPAKTPKKSYTMEIVDKDTGLQLVVESVLKDAAGNDVYEDNPAAAHTIKTLFPGERGVPTAQFPEPQGDKARLGSLEGELASLRAALMALTSGLSKNVLTDAAGAPVASGSPVNVQSSVTLNVAPEEPLPSADEVMSRGRVRTVDANKS